MYLKNDLTSPARTLSRELGQRLGQLVEMID